LHQDLQHVSIGVDCSPKPVFSPSNLNHGLVEVPFVDRNCAVVTDFGRNLRSELLAPHSDAFIQNDYAPFSQQILDIAQAQGKPMVRSNSMADDGPREPEAFQATP